MRPVNMPDSIANFCDGVSCLVSSGLWLGKTSAKLSGRALLFLMKLSVLLPFGILASIFALPFMLRTVSAGGFCCILIGGFCSIVVDAFLNLAGVMHDPNYPFESVVLSLGPMSVASLNYVSQLTSLHPILNYLPYLILLSNLIVGFIEIGRWNNGKTKGKISEVKAGVPKVQKNSFFDFEQKLKDWVSFYKKTKIDLPPDFEDVMRDIWNRNQVEIIKAIEENGFDDFLLIPGNLSLPDLKDKMSMENGYWESTNFKEGGSFVGAKSSNADKPRIVLVHSSQNLQDRPELKSTLNIKGQDVKLDSVLSLEDYLIFQRYYFAKTGKHLDEIGFTWLSTKSGARLVGADWLPASHQLHVDAGDLDDQCPDLGSRPTRCLF